MKKPRAKTVRFALNAAVIAALIIIAYVYAPGPEDVKKTIAGYGAAAPIIFIAITILKPLIFFLPSMGLTIVAGTLFGPFWGTVYVAIGGAGSTVIGFYGTRLFGRERMKRILSERTRLFAIDEKMTRGGFRTTLMLRAFNLPWDIVSYAAGLSGMRFKDFYLASLLMLVPTSFVYTYFGSTVGSVNSPQFFGALALLFVFGMLPHLYMKVRKKPPEDSSGKE
ncbi:MAG: TVP38/TMEM64 family protein [Deltaproteobacteria bacterium]|nr:TVP38/TMEM64 family protein [Deltaproteobacteria bacterium]